MRALDFEFEVLGTFDPQSTLSRFIGRPVWHTFEQAPEFDAILFTDISTAAHANYELLAGVADTQSIYVPDILVMVTEHDS